MLTACDLSSLMPTGGSREPAEPREQSSLTPNDVAIKIANFVSVFPEVGDELDMSNYISFDTGTDYKLEDFTFTSKQPDVISIENYHARCLKDGFAQIEVTGKGISKPVLIDFHVGSIEGNYSIDSTAYPNLVTLNITKENDEYKFLLKVNPNGKKYKGNDVPSYEGSGTLLKNISPFVPFNFDNAAPSAFSPITEFITRWVPDASQYADLGENVYGYMVADEYLGVIFEMRFYDEFIQLLLPQA